MDQLRAGVGAKQVVLVVDDDSAVRNSLRFTLEVEGFEVRAYPSAHELLDEDRLPTLSCLVTDYHMPAMNGLELVAQLRGRDVLIPAILVTPDPRKTCAAVPLRLEFQLSRSPCWAVVCWTQFAKLLTGI